MDHRYCSRRSLLLTTATGLGTAALAACGGSGVRSVSGAGPGTPLVPLADLAVGASTELDVDERRVLLSRPAEDTVLGFDAECPHQGCNVRATTDGGFGCPCHGSTFDPASGNPTGGPAEEPLSPVPVAIAGGSVVLV